jgi:hypothetical protein
MYKIVGGKTGIECCDMRGGSKYFDQFYNSINNYKLPEKM